MWNKEAMVNLALVMPANDAEIYLKVVQHLGPLGENECTYLTIYTPQGEGAERKFEFGELPEVINICKYCKDAVVFTADKYGVRKYC